MCANESAVNSNNPFKDKKVMVLGFFVNHSRKSILRQLVALGAKTIDKVSRFVDYVIIGEKAGKQLQKAQEIGLTILTEEEFEDMLK